MSSSIPPIEKPNSQGRINPDLYIDRELSWIAFNQHVLDEARDPRNPLLERVKFLAIFSSNLDEFFMIRVSGVKKEIVAGVSHAAPSGLTPQEQLRAIRKSLLPQLAERERLLLEDLLPALKDAGIFLLHYGELDSEQRVYIQNYYERQVFPVLTPLAIDASHPFPFISNLNVNLFVVITDPEQGQLYARVKVPEVLPRLVKVPASNGDSSMRFVWLEEVIAANLDDLFHGKVVSEVSSFRITRDSELSIQEDEASDLIDMIEEGVRQRTFGDVVRLSIEPRTSPVVRDLLTTNFEITSDDVYVEDGPLRQSSLLELYKIDRPDLKYPSFVPSVPRALTLEEGMFATMRERNILLHHPFDSFNPVTDLVRAAAHDDRVLAIKQTLYRVGRRSPVVNALMEARDEDKQVAVMVELKARFDEENNIEWSRELETRGVHVVYGLNGLKIHAKLLCIVREDDDGIRRYVHIGTGNYNASTARAYIDIGLLTTDEAIGADVTELFNVLTGYSDQKTYRKLLVAPHGLREGILTKIEREIAHHRVSGNGHLIFKCNSLTDVKIIMALYSASQAGVQIDLIVRGICCLRPGIPGVSETIRVRTIIGRFLEHSRIYFFHNSGNPEIYLGSADLMERNLDRRVEVLFPIEDVDMKRHLRDIVLDAYLFDNTQARELQSDGTYLRLTPGKTPAVNAQERLLSLATESSSTRLHSDI